LASFCLQFGSAELCLFLPNSIIADLRNHVKWQKSASILQKLGAWDRTQAALRAKEMGPI